MATKHSVSASYTLNDLLRILPSEARTTLFNALKGDSGSALEAARSACRALRDCIDQRTSGVRVGFAPSFGADKVAAYDLGRWLSPRPNCTRVQFVVDQSMLGALAVPFAAAPMEACRRIKQLEICCAGRDVPLLGVVLLSVTARLPCLTSLDLGAPAPAPDDVLERQLASHALSLLPSLTSLSLDDCDYVPLIPDCVAGRLTQLCVNAADGPDTRPSAELLASALAKMTAAVEVTLEVSLACPFRPRDVRRLLAAVPQQGQLQQLLLYPVGGSTIELGCSFANGRLDTVEWSNGDSYEAPYSEISKFLSTAVLPSRAMGPRLRLLTLRNLEADEEPPVPDPALALYARCDEVRMLELKGCEHLSAMLSLIERFGVPTDLAWDAGLDGCLDVITLRRNDEESRGAAGAAGGGAGSGNACNASGSAGGGRSKRAKPPLVALPALEVARRAVERMARAPAEGDGREGVLLRGPFVRGLMAAPPALKGWLQQVSADAEEGSIRRYRVLPSAGALVMDCYGGVRARAVAAAARRLGEAAGGGGGGQATVEAVHSELTWHDYVVQVLQALWDGEEEGGAEAPAGAPEAAVNVPQSELERLRCLLETWEGLRALPAAVRLEPLPAP